MAAFALACLIVVPGFILLYRLDQRDLLREEGLEEQQIPGR